MPVDSGITKRYCRQTSQELCPWHVEFAQMLPEGSPFAARAISRDASSREGARALAREILILKPAAARWGSLQPIIFLLPRRSSRDRRAIPLIS